MSPIFIGALYAGGLFIGIILMLRVGRYIRLRQSGEGTDSNQAVFTVIEGALFALLGLLLAFSFSGAGVRYDARRHLIIDEANCIGTAYLRLDLLLPPAKQEVQEKFRQYVDARLDAYRALPDIAKAEAGIARAVAIQGEIWTKALAASQQTGSSQATILIIPSLNAMFDIANTRYLATRIHPPKIIYWLMGVLILICSLLAGFSMGSNKVWSRVHVGCFAAMLALTIYTTVELEYPRMGLIQIRDFDQALVDVRNSMGSAAVPYSK